MPEEQGESGKEGAAMQGDVVRFVGFQGSLLTGEGRVVQRERIVNLIWGRGWGLVCCSTKRSCLSLFKQQ